MVIPMGHGIILKTIKTLLHKISYLLARKLCIEAVKTQVLNASQSRIELCGGYVNPGLEFLLAEFALQYTVPDNVS